MPVIRRWRVPPMRVQMGCEWPGRRKRARHGGAGAARGEEVRVLVCVQVRDAEARLLQAANLRSGFGFDFGGADTAEVKIGGKAAERWSQLPVGANEGRNLCRFESRSPIDQHDVAADFERGRGASQGHGIVEECARCHERGRSEHTGAMQFHD